MNKSFREHYEDVEVATERGRIVSSALALGMWALDKTAEIHSHSNSWQNLPLLPSIEAPLSGYSDVELDSEFARLIELRDRTLQR